MIRKMKLCIVFLLHLSISRSGRLEDAAFLGEGIEAHIKSEPKGQPAKNGKLVIDSDGSASASYSTGLDEPTALLLADLARSSAGDKYALMGSLKEGGRVLTLDAERYLRSIVNAASQTREIFLDGRRLDLSSAAVESKEPEIILTPQKGARVVLGDSSTSASWDGHKIRLALGQGLNQAQAHRLMDNFDKLLSWKVANVTGLPEQVVEFVTSGRNRVIDHLLQEVSPVQEISTSSSEYIVRNSTDSWLRVTLLNPGKINVEYSTGLRKNTVTTLVDSLHRAITLRISLISWSNQLMGSVPNELEESVKEVAGSQQTRIVSVDGRPVDLENAPVLESSDDKTILYVEPDTNITLTGSRDVELKGYGRLEVALSPGLSAGQVISLSSWLKSLLPSALPKTLPMLSHPLVAKIFEQKNDGWTVGRLSRGLVPRLTVDGEQVLLRNASLARTNAATVFTLSSGINISSFDDGEVVISGRKRLNVSRSTGLPWKFLKKISSALTELDQYNLQSDKASRLHSLEDEINKLIQKRTIYVDGDIIILDIAPIVNLTNTITSYQPQKGLEVKISRSGEVQVESHGERMIDISISHGITAWQAEILKARLHRLAGGSLRNRRSLLQDFLDTSTEEGELLAALIRNIRPSLNITVDGLHEHSTTHIDKEGLLIGGVFVEPLARDGYKVKLSNGSKVDFSVSSGLNLETVRSLGSQLQPLLSSSTDVLHMMIGSLKETKSKELRDFIDRLTQRVKLTVDNQKEQLSSALRYGDGKRKLIIYGKEGHEVIVSVSSGLGVQQANQLRENIIDVFRAALSKYTGIPLKVLEWASGLQRTMVDWISQALGAQGSKVVLTKPGEEDITPPSPSRTRLANLIDAVLASLKVLPRLRHKHPFTEKPLTLENALKAVTSEVKVTIDDVPLTADTLPPGLKLTQFSLGYRVSSDINRTVQAYMTPGLAPGRATLVSSLIKEILGPASSRMKFLANLPRLLFELSLRGKLVGPRTTARALAPHERLLVDGLPAVDQPNVAVTRPPGAVALSAAEGDIEAEVSQGLMPAFQRALNRIREAAGRSFAPITEAASLLMEGDFARLIAFSTAPAVSAIHDLVGEVNRTLLEDAASAMAQERRVVICGQTVEVGMIPIKGVNSSEGAEQVIIEPLEGGAAVRGLRKCPATIVISDGLPPSEARNLFGTRKHSDTLGLENKLSELMAEVGKELLTFSQGIDETSDAWVDGKPAQLIPLDEGFRLESYVEKEVRLMVSPGFGWHIIALLARPPADGAIPYVRNILDGRWEHVLARLEQPIDVKVDGQPWTADVESTGQVVIRLQRPGNVNVTIGPGLPKNQVESLTTRLHTLAKRASPVNALAALVDRLVPSKYINMVANLDTYLPFISFVDI